MTTQFRTIVTADKTDIRIDYRRPVMMIGSCFTENIGACMASELFPVMVNPNGVLYNPESISKSLLRIISGKLYGKDELLKHDSVYHSMYHHSSFSGPDADRVISRINFMQSKAKEVLAVASALIVTFGTATVFYRLGEAVGNCHKLPAQEFERRRLSVEETVGIWRDTLLRLREYNPGLKVIFTVSPIRYKAYGYHGSQTDKAVLLLAVDRMVSEFPDMAYYFPAYEIVLDDLRDYRFYDADMIHPSAQAVEYVYEAFRTIFYNRETLQTAERCSKLNRRLSHRFIVDDPEARMVFEAETEKQVSQLSQIIPNLRSIISWHSSQHLK